jgi:hypothetical protein
MDGGQMTLQIKKIKKMIYGVYPNLSGDAKAYVEGLDSLITLFPDNTEDIRQQCNYIYLTLEPEPSNKQQELVKQKILDISQGRSPQELLKRYLDDGLVKEEISESTMDFENDPLHKLKKARVLSFALSFIFASFDTIWLLMYFETSF